MTGQRKTRRVVLIGFMGAGKTSVGKVLAQRLGWKFYDLDELIETREGKSIAAIFTAAGEAGFRPIESAMLKDLLQADSADSDSIVALGGGAFAQADNREALRQSGTVTILLEAPIEELARRCSGAETRPLARDQKRFEELFLYRQESDKLAQFRIQTSGKSVKEVAEEIQALLKKLEVTL